MEPVDARLGEPYDEHAGCGDGEAGFRPSRTSRSGSSPKTDEYREKECPERKGPDNAGLAERLKLDAVRLADILIRPPLRK